MYIHVDIYRYIPFTYIYHIVFLLLCIYAHISVQTQKCASIHVLHRSLLTGIRDPSCQEIGVVHFSGEVKHHGVGPKCRGEGHGIARLVSSRVLGSTRRRMWCSTYGARADLVAATVVRPDYE